MCKIRSQQVDMDVTYDHQMYIKKQEHDKFELINASEIIGKKYKFKKNCEIYDNCDEILTINIDTNIVEYDAYLKLVGIFSFLKYGGIKKFL